MDEWLVECRMVDLGEDGWPLGNPGKGVLTGVTGLWPVGDSGGTLGRQYGDSLLRECPSTAYP